MTFPTCVVEMRKYPDEKLKTMLEEPREASKHSRKLGRVMEIVADHRLQLPSKRAAGYLEEGPRLRSR